ncbi:MAG: DUF4258 domain-containing protein [Pirellulales bacterium]
MRITYTIHAIQRMAERRISRADVLDVLAAGEVIEEDSDDQPYPTRLLLGWPRGPLHVATAIDAAADHQIVVTAYRPDPAVWLPDFRTRR